MENLLPPYKLASSKAVVLKVGSVKQGQGFRKATFVKSLVMNFEHSCQSCEQIPIFRVEWRSISTKKK